MKRSSSHKRRWGTLIEAAKSGRVSRLISRSRSEDSVCRASSTVVGPSAVNVTTINGTQESADRFSNSPGSDDAPTESATDSNRSLERTSAQPGSSDASASAQAHGKN